jgi:DNA-binding NarL/FixJ family response regulator
MGCCGGCFEAEEGVFDTKKHTNIKRRAEYRLIGKYHKSLLRFKEEKARRRRILELQDISLTIKQIALQLGVSERTVKRDLAKMKSYIHRQNMRLNPPGRRGKP